MSVQVGSGVFGVQTDQFSDLYKFNTVPEVDQSKTKLTLKYPPCAMRESVVAPAWKVFRIFLVIDPPVCPGSPVLPNSALLLSQSATSVGGDSFPSQVHDAVLMTNPLILIIKVFSEIS